MKYVILLGPQTGQPLNPRLMNNEVPQTCIMKAPWTGGLLIKLAYYVFLGSEKSLAVMIEIAA